jgi:hypothetical protein
MLRLVLLLLIIAGVAGYFTRPDEAKMRQGADAVLQNPQDLGEGLQSIGAGIAGDRAYDNYYVAAKYTVSLDHDPVVQCWGYFTQVSCSRVEHAQSSSS